MGFCVYGIIDYYVCDMFFHVNPAIVQSVTVNYLIPHSQVLLLLLLLGILLCDLFLFTSSVGI